MKGSNPLRATMNYALAAYRAANQSGTSLLEMANRLGVSARALEVGSVGLDKLAADCGISIYDLLDLAKP